MSELPKKNEDHQYDNLSETVQESTRENVPCPVTQKMRNKHSQKYEDCSAMRSYDQDKPELMSPNYPMNKKQRVALVEDSRMLQNGWGRRTRDMIFAYALLVLNLTLIERGNAYVSDEITLITGNAFDNAQKAKIWTRELVADDLFLLNIVASSENLREQCTSHKNSMHYHCQLCT